MWLRFSHTHSAKPVINLSAGMYKQLPAGSSSAQGAAVLYGSIVSLTLTIPRLTSPVTELIHNMLISITAQCHEAAKRPLPCAAAACFLFSGVLYLKQPW